MDTLTPAERLRSQLGIAAHDDDLTVDAHDLRALLDELDHLRAVEAAARALEYDTDDNMDDEYAAHEALRDALDGGA